MWIRINEQTLTPLTRNELVLERVNRITQKIQFNEGASELQSDLDLISEGDNKIFTWAKAQVEKFSPENIGEFIKKWGKKIDDKMSNAKNQSIKNVGKH